MNHHIYLGSHVIAMTGNKKKSSDSELIDIYGCYFKDKDQHLRKRVGGVRSFDSSPLFHNFVLLLIIARSINTFSEELYDLYPLESPTLSHNYE